MDPPFIAVLLTLYLYVVLYVQLQLNTCIILSLSTQKPIKRTVAILSYVKIYLQIKKITIIFKCSFLIFFYHRTQLGNS